jgi:DNA-binding HxlR family transcriptional regulator
MLIARIVWALIRTETVRYSQVRAARSPISDRILSKELRELEELGLISRKEYPVVPPKTEYQLTTVGRTLEPVMAAMADWGTARRLSRQRRMVGAKAAGERTSEEIGASDGATPSLILPTRGQEMRQGGAESTPLA